DSENTTGRGIDTGVDLAAESRDLERTVRDGPGRPAPAPAALPAFAGYELLGEIGHGGMGVVYRARQVRADRIVALKIIKGGAAVDSQERERFRSEARALGRIRHPNIVQVYDVGEEAGCPYFSMEYIDGDSLAQKVKRDGPLPQDA